MSIAGNNLSNNNGGQRFSLSNTPFGNQPITVDDIDLNDDIGSSTAVIRPAKKGTGSVGRNAPSGSIKSGNPDKTVSDRKGYEDRPAVGVSNQDALEIKRKKSNVPKLSLTREQIKLDPFQQSILYSLVPVRTTINLEDGLAGSDKVNEEGIFQIPITSSCVEGESGSGLTLMLAKRAYENFQDGRPTIILANREQNLHKIAQSIIDFAKKPDDNKLDTSERASLLKNIEIVSGGDDMYSLSQKKRIYIISTDKLVSFLNGNESYRPLAQLARGSLIGALEDPYQTLASVLPIDRIREVIVDDFHAYTGYSNEGYTKVLNQLLLETSKNSQRNPVHLFGTSSTPYDRSIDPDQAGKPGDTDREGSLKIVEFDNYFPSQYRQKTPSAKALIQEEKIYKTPEKLSLLNLDDVTAHEMKHADAKNRLHDSGENSINDQVVKLFLKERQIVKKKWHIIANSREHATELCALFNLRGVNARVATSVGYQGSEKVGHTGYFVPLTRELNEHESRKNFYVLNNSETPEGRTLFERVDSKSDFDILKEFEDPGKDVDVVIDLDTPSLHSTKTDKVVDLTLRYDPSNTHIKRLLGEAARDRSGPGFQTIEYLFLNSDNLEVFNNLINGNELELGVMSKQSSVSSAGSSADSLRTEANVEVVTKGGIQYNQNWYDVALGKVLKLRYDDDQAIDRLVEDFSSLHPEVDLKELKSIVSGLTRNQEIFSTLVDFLEKDLKIVFLGQNADKVSFDIKTKLNIKVPDLMGVNDEKIAFKILEDRYNTLEEDFVVRNIPFDYTQAWINFIDSRLAARANQGTEQRRLEFFTEVIAKKFGLEFFENRSFLDRTLRVFSGDTNTIDFKLFGLLFNIVYGNDNIPTKNLKPEEDPREIFRDLLGERDTVSFKLLQRNILARYPDGPPLDQSLRRFFAEQLYDDFEIDLFTLYDSVNNHSEALGQRLIDQDVRDDLQNFLESQYAQKVVEDFGSNDFLKPDPAILKREINLKALENLSIFHREVLYTQLIAKIWGHGRPVRISDDDFVFSVDANDIELKPRAVFGIEKNINLNIVNPDLAIALDHGVYGSIYPRVDIKKRLAFIVGSFLAQRHNISSEKSEVLNTINDGGDEYKVISSQGKRRYQYFDAEIHPESINLERDLSAIEVDELKVLLGSTPIKELTDADKDLLRDFFKFNKMKLNQQLPKFYDRLGVKDIDEAKLVIKSELKKFSDSNPEWMKLYGSQDEFVSHLAEFFYNNPIRKDIFTRPEALIQSLKILSGNLSQAQAEGKLERAQNLNREFIKFLNTKDLNLKTEDLVLNFREQIGLKTRDELFALMRQPGFVNFLDSKSDDNPNKWQNRTTNGVERFVTQLAKKLDLDPSIVFALAELKEPSNFYREPLSKFRDTWSGKIDFDISTQTSIDSELQKLLSEYGDSIKSRQLLVDVYGEDYKYSSIFTLPESDAQNEDVFPNLRVEIKSNKVIFTDEHPNADFVKPGQPKRLDKDFQEYSYLDGAWKLTGTQEDINKKHYRVSQTLSSILASSKLDENWLKHLGITKDVKPEDANFQKLVLVLDKFFRYLCGKDDALRTKLINNRDSFKSYMQLLLGDPIFSEKGLTYTKQAFRDFIEFINTEALELGVGPIDLNQVIKESPKLTGVRTFDELKSTLDFNFSSYENFQNEILKIKPNALTKDYLDFISKFTNTSPDVLLSFTELNEVLSNYQVAMKKLILPDTLSDQFAEDLEAKTTLLSTILVRQIFPKASDNTYYLWGKRFRTQDSKDVLINLIFTNNRLQSDIFYERNNLPYEIFSHETMDYDSATGNWNKVQADEKQKKARFTLMRLFGEDVTGKEFLSNTSHELLDAYDATLSKGYEHDYLFLKVTNLMADFIVADDSEFFNSKDDDVQKGLFNKMASLLGNVNHLDRAFLNRFIDFAEARHPGFAELRNDTRFKDIFFETKIDTGKRDSEESVVSKKISTQLLVDAIRKIPVTTALQIFNGGSDKKRALTELIQLTEKHLTTALPEKISVEDIEKALDVPQGQDMVEHLRQPYALMSVLVEQDQIGTSNELFPTLKDACKNMPFGFPDFLLDKHQATMAFSKLYPSQDFNFTRTSSLNNLDHFSISNAETGDEINFGSDLRFEFDGKNLILVQYNLSDSGNVSGDSYGNKVATQDDELKIISTVTHDPKTGLWVPRRGANPKALVESQEQMRTALQDVFTVADIHALERRTRANGDGNDSRLIFCDYVQNLLGLSDDEMHRILYGDNDSLERYKDPVADAYVKHGGSPESRKAVINAITQSALQAKNDDFMRKTIAFQELMMLAFPRFTDSLQGSASLTYTGIGQVAYAGNDLQVAEPATRKGTSYRYNSSSKSWEIDRYLMELSPIFASVHLGANPSINTQWLKFFDQTIGTELLNPSSAVESSRPTRRVKHVARFIEDKYPTAIGDHQRAAAIIRTLAGDTKTAGFNPELFTEFVNYMSEPFPAMQEALTRFPSLSGVTANRGDKKLSTEQKMIKHIRDNTDTQKLLRDFAQSRTRSAVLEPLFYAAETSLRADSYSPTKIYQELKTPVDMKAHINKGLKILNNFINREILGVDESDASKIKRLIGKNIIDSLPDTRVREDKAHHALKKLFPDLSFDNEHTGGKSHLITARNSSNDILLKSGDKEFFIEYDGNDLHLLRRVNPQAKLEKIYTVRSSLQGDWIYQIPGSTKVQLSNDDAITLLRQKYPDGLSSLRDLENICSSLGIDYEELKTLIPSETYLENARKILNRFDIPVKIKNVFTGDFNRLGSLLQNILLGQKIWGEVISIPNLALVQSDVKVGQIYTTLENNGSISFRTRSNNQATKDNFNKDKLIYRLELDQPTGMFIPYKDGEVLTLKNERNELLAKTLRDLISERVANQFIKLPGGKIQNDGVDQTLDDLTEYLIKITGKSEDELYESFGVHTNIEEFYKPVFEKLPPSFGDYLKGPLKESATKFIQDPKIQQKLRRSELIRFIWADQKVFQYVTHDFAEKLRQDGKEYDLRLSMSPRVVSIDVLNDQKQIVNALLTRFGKNEPGAWGPVSQPRLS